MRRLAAPLLAMAATVAFVVVVLVAVVRDPVRGDTDCGPFWSQVLLPACRDFNTRRTLVVIGGTTSAVILGEYARLNLSRRRKRGR